MFTGFGDGFSVDEARAHMSSWLLQHIDEVSAGVRPNSLIPVIINVDSGIYYSMMRTAATGGQSVPTGPITLAQSYGVKIIKQTVNSVEGSMPIDRLLDMGQDLMVTGVKEGSNADAYLAPLKGTIYGPALPPGGLPGIKKGSLTLFGLPVWAVYLLGGSVVLFGLSMAMRGYKKPVTI
jgi:hypothetical protein